MIVRLLLSAMSLVALLGACDEPRPKLEAPVKPAEPAARVPAYVAEMKRSVALCKTMMADLPTYYGKPQKLVARLQLSKEYNYKYLKKEATHVAFEVECGNTTFNVYGPTEKFGDLVDFVRANPPRTTEITVMTDKSHGNPQIWTLLEWRKPPE